MTEPRMMAVAAPVAVRSGRKGGRSHVLGGLVVAGLLFGVACGAADSVSDSSARCVPQLCVAPDKPPGPPDGETLCPTGVCNYQTQAGCPSNQTCAVHIDTALGEASPKCVAVGVRKAGEPCDTKTTPSTPELLCARGLQCIGEAGKDQICRKLCCGGAPYGDWRACDPGESCIRQIKPIIEQPPGSKTFIELDAHVSFCVPVNTCDVLNSTSCKDDPVRPVCRIVDPLGRVACRPKQPAGSEIGSPCDKIDQCGPVQHCARRTDSAGVSLQDTPRCRRLCRLDDQCGPDGCENEGVCVHFERDPQGVGECTPNFDRDLLIEQNGVRVKACHDLDGGFPMTSMTSTPPPPSDGGTG